MADNGTTEGSKHLTYFKIENFKGFESFEMEDIGQFNVIVGDNNVGKTSVLEALCFDEDARQWVGNLANILFFKKLFDATKSTDIDIRLFLNITGSKKAITVDTKIDKYILEQKNVDELSVTDRNHYFSLYPNKNLGSKIALFKSSEGQRILPLSYDYASTKGIPYTPYLPTNIYSEEDDLVYFYSNSIQSSRNLRDQVIGDLKVFIPQLENIELSTSVVVGKLTFIIRLIRVDNTLPLKFQGDGAIKLFRILLEIVVCKGKRLMIDEIDAGIHYSRFKDFWRTVLKAAKRNNVQLFATTHNMECLTYLKEVLEEGEMKDYQELTRSYTMVKSPKGEVKAFKYLFKDFEYSLNQDIEIRGNK